MRLIPIVMTALLLIVTPVLAQADIYTDPQDRFTAPIPTNWTATTIISEDPAATYVTFTDPDSLLPIHILVVPGATVAEGLQAAWEIVDPDFDLEIAQTQALPASKGIDEAAQIVYDTGSQSDIALGVGQRIGDTVYALLGRGDMTTFAQRNSQVVIILSGLNILSVEKTSLAGVEPITLDENSLAELDAFIEEWLPKFEIPGAAVAIVQNGEVIHLKGYGVRELGSPDPITPDTLMMIGSTGKTMTTLMLATLVDDGLLDWETPVVDILPTFAVNDPERTQQIHVRHLVCACTGVPRRDFELLFNASDLSAEDIIESLQTFDFFTDFGEAFQYSNQMVGTGGYIAALAAGGEYGDLFNAYAAIMDERVFDPIGMERTTFDFAEVEADDNYASPHAINLNDEYYPLPLSMEQTLTPIAPAGASWSTAADMAQYLITQLNNGVNADGERVVSVENLDKTREAQVAVSADSDYGLGWFVDDYKGLQLIQHGGNTLGFSSEFGFLPEVDLGIVVLTNAQASNIINVAIRERLFEIAFEQEPAIGDVLTSQLAQAEEQFAAILADLSDEIDAEAVEPYLGTYTNDALGAITLSLVDSELILDAGEFQTTLWAVTSEDAEPNTYIMSNAPLPTTPVSLRDEDGEPVVVVGQSIAEYTFTAAE